MLTSAPDPFLLSPRFAVELGRKTVKNQRFWEVPVKRGFADMI